mgnify:CR=1 FL=1
MDPSASLPDELMLAIFLRLKAKELCCCSLVNLRWGVCMFFAINVITIISTGHCEGSGVVERAPGSDVGRKCIDTFSGSI